MAQKRSTKKSTRFPARRIVFSIFGAMFLLAGCNQLSLLDTLGTQGEGGPLTLEPATARIARNGTMTFIARGGDRPYRFEMAGGLGRINSDTGVYTAPATSPLTETIRLVDNSGTIRTASIEVTGPGTPPVLALTPAAVTVPPGGQVNFVAGGGTGFYTFSLTALGSGSPSIGTTSGVYTAGTSLGSDTVQVTDGVDTLSAVITVAAGTTDVDYTVGSLAFPLSGTAGQAFLAPSAFLITNNGTSAGAETVYWHAYLSQDGTLGPGDYLVDQGTEPPIAAGDSVTVDVAGSWPAYTGGANFFVRAFAQDDSTPGNNTSGAFGVSILPADVEYAVTAVNHTGGVVSGASFTGAFSVENNGTDPGTEPVFWTAYVSTDTVLDAGDVVVDGGSFGGLAAGASVSPAFDGTWPTSPAPPTDFYILVEIGNVEDTTLGDNTLSSAAVALVGRNVENEVQNPGVTGGSNVAGEAFTGSLTLANNGTDAGSGSMSWDVYVSEDDVLDAGDYLVASGSALPLAAGATTTVNYTGYWPLISGTTYRLIATVSSTDPVTVPTAVSGPYAVIDRAVDYAVSNVSIGAAGPHPGDSVDGSFDITHVAADDGLQTITWKVYTSLDDTLSSGDVRIDSGTLGPLSPGGNTSVVFSGVSPLRYGSYYVIVEINAGDDGNSANNVAASGLPFTVGRYDETPSEPNNDFAGLTDAFELGVVLRPGMRLEVIGNTTDPPGDEWDIIGFNTGTASRVTFSWIVDSGDFDLDIYIYDDTPTTLYSDTATGDVPWLFAEWLVDTANAPRYIDLTNASSTPISGYRLIIAAE